MSLLVQPKLFEIKCNAAVPLETAKVCLQPI